MTTSPHSHITVFVEQISGDRNSIEITSLLSIDPYLRQTVREVARGQNIFDVIVTNLARYFNEPVIIPPIMPDRAGHGAPSDHNGVSATPNTSQGRPANRNIAKKVIRPLPESLLPLFEMKLSAQNCDVLTNLSSFWGLARKIGASLLKHHSSSSHHHIQPNYKKCRIPKSLEN